MSKPRSYFEGGDQIVFTDVGFDPVGVPTHVARRAGMTILKYQKALHFYRSAPRYVTEANEPDRQDLLYVKWGLMTDSEKSRVKSLGVCISALCSFIGIDDTTVRTVKALVEEENGFTRDWHPDLLSIRRGFVQLIGDKYVQAMHPEHPIDVGLELESGDIYGMQFRTDADQTIRHQVIYFNGGERGHLPNTSLFIDVHDNDRTRIIG